MTTATPVISSEMQGVMAAGPPSSNMPLLRQVGMAGLALVSGLAVVSWLAQLGQVNLTGYLKAEQNVVYAPGGGRVLRLNAKSGEAVKPRQPLMQLVDDKLEREIAAASLEMRSLEAGLEQCRAKADVQISQQVESLDDKIHKTSLETAKYRRDQFSADFEHSILRDYARNSTSNPWQVAGPAMLDHPQRLFGAVGPEPVIIPDDSKVRAIMKREDAKNAAEVAKACAETCENHIQGLQRLREALPDKIRKAAGVDVAEGRMALAAQQLTALQVQKAELTIASQGHGIVGEFRKQPVDPVIAGEPLVIVLDRERPFIEVDVPSRRINKIKVGQPLRLEFSDESFTGRIESISPQAHRRDGSEDTWIPVRIGPAGKLWPEMPIGSAVSVRLK